MKTLYLRIYLTVVAALLLFALLAGWLFQRNVDSERARFEAGRSDRLAAWAELLQGALPPAEAPPGEQAEALLEWSSRLRVPLALEDVRGARVATSPVFARATGEAPGAPNDAAGGAPAAPDGRAPPRGPTTGVRDPQRGPNDDPRVPQRVSLSDGRTLLMVRGPPRDGGRPLGPGRGAEPPPFLRGVGLALTLVVLFVAVAAGAFPVVRRLTRRLEALKQGVETFGSGALHHRVDASGRDEVAAVAASFNAAAERVESLVVANRSLLANASHELRSPLARLKMAVALLEAAPPERRAPLRREIEQNIGELDALVEEVLLASRLDAPRGAHGTAAPTSARDPVDLLALAAEEAARVDALLEPPADGLPATVFGDERLLRRALRNLLENARRYGGGDAPTVRLECKCEGEGEGDREGDGARLLLRVCDRGAGVPEALRERIFEPFYRLPGHAEQAGGVGLGLSLVRQIARHHGATVHCEPRAGGGSCFVLTLPLPPLPPPSPSPLSPLSPPRGSA